MPVTPQYQLPSKGKGTIKGFTRALRQAHASQVPKLNYFSLRWRVRFALLSIVPLKAELRRGRRGRARKRHRVYI